MAPWRVLGIDEWHAANTSKKIRAVWKAKAKEGVFHGKKATYG